MKVVYMSLTGNTRKFVKKLAVDSLEINPTNPFVEINEKYILIVPTYETEATDIVDDFLGTGSNQSHCIGVVGGGNLNFANLYCFTAKNLSKRYDLPLIHCFEFQGNPRDVATIKQIMMENKSKEV